MVGVPGKYKGCETCRARRVKCDNQRPYCKKCLDNGRQCAGYERETVFIIGTIQDEGRCSSHPPRVVKSTTKRGGKAAKKKAAEEEEEKLAPVAVEPLQPAWDDLICLSNAGKQYRVQVAALQTTLQAVVRDKDEAEPVKFTLVSLPPYEPPNLQPSLRDDDFDLRAQCLMQLDEDAGSDAMEMDEEGTSGTDGICLFLYEHNNSVKFSNQAPWRDPSVQANPVRQAGPGNFRTFPNHHFFVRVYRPSAICAALLNRKPSFLSSPEWLSTPWESHPKSPLDHLLDIVVFLPGLFHRADRIFPHDPTLQRRLMAQDLLANCLSLERQLDAWWQHDAGTGTASADPSTAYWIEDPLLLSEGGGGGSGSGGSQIPFADTFAFRSGQAAVAAIYYWTALVLLYPCIARLHEAIFQRVVDAFPQPEPSSAAAAQRLRGGGGGRGRDGGDGTMLTLDPRRYSGHRTREVAAGVCRSLDFALGATGQPDLLGGPLQVVHEFYLRGVGESGDGQLELMWCEGFRGRLQARGGEVADVVGGRRWRDLCAW